jgi:hypothetical protein
VRIGNPAVVNSDLDLYLFDCTTGSCVQRAVSGSATADEQVAVPNPAAGTWVALVVGYAVPGGTTAYDYTDSFTTPALGTINITDADALRATGATWTVPATVTAASVPPAGRKLRGDINVRTSDGSVVGGGVVEINAVS